MNLTLSLAPLMSLIAGILILIVPRLLNYIERVAELLRGQKSLLRVSSHPLAFLLCRLGLIRFRCSLTLGLYHISHQFVQIE
jgi:hypothetical protein